MDGDRENVLSDKDISAFQVGFPSKLKGEPLIQRQERT
jgi:hypothetical protein